MVNSIISLWYTCQNYVQGTGCGIKSRGEAEGGEPDNLFRYSYLDLNSSLREGKIRWYSCCIAECLNEHAAMQGKGDVL